MRAFIAIELTREIKNTLAALQAALKKYDPDAKWVPVENIHLTLKFLGEIDETTRETAVQALQDACASVQSFSITIAGAGAFPNSRFPRIIWAGISQGDLETKKLAGIIEERLEAAGIPREDREFSSHITIARVRAEKNTAKLAAQLPLAEKLLEGKPVRMPVNAVTLFKSTLTSRGPLYEPLDIIPMATA